MRFFSLLYFCFNSAKWNRLHAAAKQYAADHKGENYFSALIKVSCGWLRKIVLKILWFCAGRGVWPLCESGCLVLSTELKRYKLAGLVKRFRSWRFER